MRELLDNMAREGLLGTGGLERVRSLQSEGKTLDEALVEAAGAGQEKLLRRLAAQFGVLFVDLEQQRPPDGLLERFPARILIQQNLLPIEQKNGVVVVATSRIFDTEGLDELRVATGTKLQPALAPPDEIERCLRKYLGVGAETVHSLVSDAERAGVEVLASDDGDEVDLAEAAGDASIIKFVNQVLAEAIERRATDVHIEPFENQLKVRYRVDGVLQEASIPPGVRQFHASIVSRLKILSQLDIAEKRLPQDGRMKLKIRGREIDVRVSVIPMLHGEAVVLRLLDRSTTLLGLENLGMSPRDRKRFETVLGVPHGIVLVTGPTGSGKTTTLYAGLARLNNAERKIITIEDPIEYHMAGINQIQVSGKTGLTFARGLRAVLRHDPDIILVGEIRDHETAEIAVQASLTGHLVFSTLHTNDAPGALTRLVDMGVEPYLVASSLELVLAQRLVRLVCPKCKVPIPVADADRLRRDYGADLPDALFCGRGCRDCNGTGYRGRIGIFELMPVTDTIRQLTIQRTSSDQIHRAAVKEGMESLRHDGWRLVREGKSTLEEILRSSKDEPARGEA